MDAKTKLLVEIGIAVQSLLPNFAESLNDAINAVVEEDEDEDDPHAS